MVNAEMNVGALIMSLQPSLTDKRNLCAQGQFSWQSFCMRMC